MSSKKREKPRSFPVVMSTSAERRKALEDKEAAKEKEAAATADVMKMAHSASKSDSGSPQRRRSVGAQKLSERKSSPTRDDTAKTLQPSAASLQPPANASIQPSAKVSYVAAVQKEAADNKKAADIEAAALQAAEKASIAEQMAAQDADVKWAIQAAKEQSIADQKKCEEMEQLLIQQNADELQRISEMNVREAAFKI